MAIGALLAVAAVAALAVGIGRGKGGQPAGGGSSGASGLPTLEPDMVAKGEELYARTCQACHGVDGVGERPGDPAAVDDQGLPVAPALDSSMHAWHHTDDGLVQTILQGSPRNPRMQPWGEAAGLTESDARAIVEYMKSLWDDMPRRCQGPKHMDPNCVYGQG